MADTRPVPSKNEGYRLIRPCLKCPFRSDVTPYIRPQRAVEIAEALRRGSEFPCHETTVCVVDEQDEEHFVQGRGSQFCAGALITMEREGFANQMMRISERIGVYDRDGLDMDAPVSDSLNDWVRRFFPEGVRTVAVDGEELEFEHCGVVGPDCVDPAGYATGGGAVDNPEPPQCHPVDDTCGYCGSPMCAECRGEDDERGVKRCLYCVEED